MRWSQWSRFKKRHRRLRKTTGNREAEGRVWAQKETQSSKERCARMTAHGYCMFSECTTSHLGERETPQQPTFARVLKPSSKKQVGTAMSWFKTRQKTNQKFRHIIHLGAEGDSRDSRDQPTSLSLCLQLSLHAFVRGCWVFGAY